MLTNAYLDQLHIRDVVRMADRYPEAMEYVVSRMREPAPQYPPHGERRGFIAAELDGQTMRAELLSTGKHCRSYGVEIVALCRAALWADQETPNVKVTGAEPQAERPR